MNICSLATLAGCAALSSAAVAVDNTQIIYQVSTDNAAWFSDLLVQPGDTVYCRAVVSFIHGSHGTTTPVGLAAFVFQPTVSNWDNVGTGSERDTLLPFVNNGAGGNTSFPLGVVTDPSNPTAFGRVSPYGRINFSATSAIRGHLNESSGISYLRIAQATATSFIGGPGNSTGGQGVPISQLSDVGRTASDPAFNPALEGIVVFKFGIVLSSDGGSRNLLVDAPIAGFGNRNSVTGDREVYWFGSLTESTGQLRGTPIVTPAYIQIGVISRQPTDQTVAFGAPATFTVVGSGDNVQYQWRHNAVPLTDDGHYGGTQSATLTISSALLPDAGPYDVIVTSSEGTATSRAAQLSLTCAPPVYTHLPQSLRVSPCQTVVFFVGTEPTYYPQSFRWRRNGVDLVDNARISGSMTRTLTISPAGFFTGGSYSALVGYGCDAQATPPVTLIIDDPADFNGDGDIGTDADISDFFACLAGNCCANCFSTDLDGDGDTGTDADIESFFRTLAGGDC